MPPKGKGKKKAGQYTANQLFTGFMAVTASFLVFALWPEMTETRGYDAYLTKLGVRRSRVETVCSGSGDDRTCGLVAKRNIDRGERVITIPTSAIIQTTTIIKEPSFEKALAHDSESLISGFAEAALPMEYLYPAFVMSFKLWHEKKMGSSSELYAWFDLLPKKINHAMFFTDTEATCLDRISFDERNSSMNYAKGFATVAKSVCETHKDLYSCAYLDSNTVEQEFMVAYATMSQRTWGDIRSPMLIPMVDFAFPHPQLCNPKGDGDVKCVGRDKQFFLQPSQDGEDTLVMKSITYAMKDEPIYSLATARAPWETLATFGYADFAATIIPDLEFSSRFQQFVQKNKLQVDALAKDHPLKECSQRSHMGWGANGIPKKELRNCWEALFYFTEHPEHLVFDEDARDAHAAWAADDVAQAKSRFLAWRHTGAAAQHIGSLIVANRGEHCNEDSGRLPIIKNSMDVSRAIFSRIGSFSEKKVQTAFSKWAALDETAAMDVAEPVAPAKEEVDETIATDAEGDESE
eukprot:TRINITY_DN10552_c0_g3_i1.p2 TRINITY_DN10552_c0_g3~~TRINITY_DN10552_c0_g3_i1.p2  ORF type:complete len:521 (+),score=197.70 TRINITY_DN10552_c0_g3_i1:66-1628(+)